jgi:hypothetical protein
MEVLSFSQFQVLDLQGVCIIPVNGRLQNKMEDAQLLGN